MLKLSVLKNILFSVSSVCIYMGLFDQKMLCDLSSSGASHYNLIFTANCKWKLTIMLLIKAFLTV